MPILPFSAHHKVLLRSLLVPFTGVPLGMRPPLILHCRYLPLSSSFLLTSTRPADQPFPSLRFPDQILEPSLRFQTNELINHPNLNLHVPSLHSLSFSITNQTNNINDDDHSYPFPFFSLCDSRRSGFIFFRLLLFACRAIPIQGCDCNIQT